MKKGFKLLGLLVLTGCLFYGFIYFWSGVLKPDLPDKPLQYSLDLIEETEALRDIRFGPEDEYAIQRNVDYREGEKASWYPKNESPILAQLVKEGKLPPVAERVGPEPVVIEGVDGIGRLTTAYPRMSKS